MNAALEEVGPSSSVRGRPTFDVLAVNRVKTIRINRASGGRHNQGQDTPRMTKSKIQARPASHGLRDEPNLLQLEVINQRQQVAFKKCRIYAAGRDAGW